MLRPPQPPPPTSSSSSPLFNPLPNLAVTLPPSLRPVCHPHVPHRSLPSLLPLLLPPLLPLPLPLLPLPPRPPPLPPPPLPLLHPLLLPHPLQPPPPLPLLPRLCPPLRPLSPPLLTPTLSLRSFNILISAFACSRNLSLAYSHFNSILKTPHLTPDAETYRLLTQALCRKSQLGTAHHLLNDMHNKGMAADKLTYSTLLNNLCRKKARLREAYKVLCRMKVKGCNPDVVHYNTLIAGFCREGRPLDARKVFDDMSRAGEFSEHPDEKFDMSGYRLGERDVLCLV